MSFFEISGRKVGPEYAPLVIAEIGINHGGSLHVAKEMADAAKRAGVEVVKHQTHVVEDEMSAEAKKVIPGNADVSIYEIMEECALSIDEEKELKGYVESLGMIYISTPFSRAAADALELMDVPAYKIGSGECNNYPLVEHIAKFGKPIILSTGMNTIESIRPAVEIFEKYKVPYALLHCTNVYPTPHSLVRLGGMQELQQHFPDAVVGLSDHSIGNSACLGAVALGASVLERHFTDHMDRKGPDIVCSMDESECASLITMSREIHSCLGGKKEAAQEEQPTIDFAFASVVAIKDILEGEEFNKDNIWVKRPGTGEIKAKDFEQLLKGRASRKIENGQQLSWADIV
ncbi:N-acetylneuraminate synthase family protein [Microbulbifer sp. OS29]|uniref:N-acetylneuraminate synthase family protein n=1 Tax=Microbulbifer okhotskensis TaxID=2926617 RepID=A0A9X2ER94_9GAMM|nr:N-acetylneuraminate synthase family protein [Microbulbifer okhotskensis]MCO1335930.1 N-acetylneuraminate synthase family protein [Microbulbifer okhotskensis]